MHTTTYDDYAIIDSLDNSLLVFSPGNLPYNRRRFRSRNPPDNMLIFKFVTQDFQKHAAENMYQANELSGYG